MVPSQLNQMGMESGIKPSFFFFFFFFQQLINNRLWLDNTLLIDTWSNQTNPTSTQLHWEAGRAYAIKLEYYRNESSEVTLGWNLVGNNAIADAVICSLSSDVS